MGDESVKPDSASTVRVLYKMTDRKGKDLQNPPMTARIPPTLQLKVMAAVRQNRAAVR